MKFKDLKNKSKKIREKILIKYNIYRFRKNNSPLIRKSFAQINNQKDLKEKINEKSLKLLLKIFKKYPFVEWYFKNYNLNLALKIYIYGIKEKDLLCPVCKKNYKDIKDKSMILHLCKNCLPTKEGKEYLKKIKISKTKKTSLEKYGVENIMKLDQAKEKHKNTILKKYGVFNFSQKNLKNLDKLNKEFIENNFLDENKKFRLYEFINFYNCDQSSAHGYLKKFNIKYSKQQKYSLIEKEIIKFIKEYYQGELIENSKSIINPYELDIYIPEKNLAIEFNGLLWHSYGKKIYNNSEENHLFQKFRHLKKTKACEKKKINLLHVFENEWKDSIKKDIWKSVILYKLGLIKENFNNFYARKLNIKEVPSELSKSFLEENHLQGYAPARIKLGLYEDKRLISIMTFSKARFRKGSNLDTYELIRFASRKYSTCIGCAQKLLKHFIKIYNPKSIVSYANRRWASSFSNLYEKLGFRYTGESEPNYFYFNLKDYPNIKLYNRINFQKHKLRNIEEFKDYFNESLSETEILFNAGYRKIFDSGNLVYFLDRDLT